MICVSHYYRFADRGVPDECECGRAKEEHPDPNVDLAPIEARLQAATILFKPAPAYREAMFRPTPKGGQVPIEKWFFCPKHHPNARWPRGGNCCSVERSEQALVLVWEGRVDEIGCDRLSRILNMPLLATYSDSEAYIRAALGDRCEVGTLIELDEPV